MCINGISKREYRIAEVSYSDFNNDLSDKEFKINKKNFLDPMKKYFDAQEIKTDWKVIDSAPIEILINSLAQSCPFTSPEKQALLEAEDIASRADLMISLFEIAAAGSIIKMN